MRRGGEEECRIEFSALLPNNKFCFFLFKSYGKIICNIFLDYEQFDT